MGLYAAFYAGLRGLKTRLLEALPGVGGQLATLYPEMDIFDVPGFVKINARDLVHALAQQAERFEPDDHIYLNTRARSLTREKGLLLVEDNHGHTHRTRKLIIASGIGAMTPRKLDNPHIQRMEGRGVYYFTCERSRLRGKRVLVVGGGDSAVLWALNLRDWASEVMLIHRSDVFGAKDAYVAELKDSGISVYMFHELKDVIGKQQVEQAVLLDNRSGEETIVDVDAVLLCLGFQAERKFLQDWGLALANGGVQVDGFMQTNLEGVYAIGDASAPQGGINLKLIATGMAQAAIAVNHAAHQLNPDQPIIPPHSSAKRL